MVQINQEARNLAIELEGCDAEGLVDIQFAIIELVRNFNWKELQWDMSNTMYHTMNLLEATLLNEQQMKRALIDNNYLEYPENMSEKQRKLIDAALFEIRTGNIVQGRNPITKILMDLEQGNQ
jgi:hypothetical protein